MRWVDDNLPEAQQELAWLYPHTGNAYFIGITGNPGAGKSTLVDALIKHLRDQNLRVGCVAIDPTSPFSGGAILGDRVRMQQHSLDRGVFIRSVATRGNLGGIARSTPAMVQILDAMGFDIVIIETIGVGQGEVDIVRLADAQCSTCTTVRPTKTPGGHQFSKLQQARMRASTRSSMQFSHTEPGSKHTENAASANVHAPSNSCV